MTKILRHMKKVTKRLIISQTNFSLMVHRKCFNSNFQHDADRLPEYKYTMHKAFNDSAKQGLLKK